jgi:hypothetical protein
MKKNFFLLFALLCQVLGVAAEDRVYINDFGIKAGETKRIELCFDTEATNVKNVQGTITMPAGLTIIDQGSGQWLTGNADRGAGMANMNPSTGAVTITTVGGYISAGTGAIAYIDVQADASLAETSTITLSGFTAKYGSGTSAPTNNVSSTNCTVTREAGEGGGGEGGGEQSNELTFAFSPESLSLIKGQVATVDVTMANGMSLTGMQATLTAGSGLTITSVTKSDRMVGTFSYNSENGNIVALGSISGNEGTVFTVTLKVDDDFTGSTTLTVGGLTATTAAAASISADDITLPVDVVGPAVITLSQDKVALSAGASASVDVLFTSSISLNMLQATLELPENVTATITNKINESYMTYNSVNGLILYMGGAMGQPLPAGTDYRLCTLTLTAADGFAASGEVKLTGITTATAAAQSIGVPDVALPVEIAVTLDEIEENDAVLEALDGQTCTVTLQRTLAAGSWNTFAVPFAVGAETLSALGFSAVKALESTTFDGETLTLNFTDAESVEAGKPYLVKVAADVTNPVFDGAVVSKEPTPTVTTYADFIPTLGKTLVTGPTGDEDNEDAVLFLAAGNTLKNPTVVNDPEQQSSYLKGFRAYFQLKDDSNARSITLNLGDESTGITTTDFTDSTDKAGAVYDLQGRKVNAAQKGVYIQNGRKVVIK